MILIVHPSQKQAKEIADVFYYMGIPASARRPKEALSEASLCYRAILICKPSALPSPEDYAKRLRSVSGGVPLFALAEVGEDHALAPLFEEIFDESSSSARVLTRIRRLQSERALPLLGSYSLAGLSLDCDLACPHYCDAPIGFTKTETMILRYLVRTYPDGADVHHILRYAMRPTSLSEPSGIRTHIWGINRKFFERTGRRLIESIPGEGYRILTPEVEAALV
jgi:hypothetical protein